MLVYNDDDDDYVPLIHRNQYLYPIIAITYRTPLNDVGSPLPFLEITEKIQAKTESGRLIEFFNSHHIYLN